jgi:tetratricopeptide (TPR) repeat protein
VDAGEKNLVRTLAVSLHELSEIQRGQGSVTCEGGYREALSLAESIQDSQASADCAFNLGHAYKDLGAIRDLAVAEQWYQRSLDLRANKDRMGRAGCLVQLGTVAYHRFLDARATNRSPAECFDHAEKAEQYLQHALEMFPPNAVPELATTHMNLGNVYSQAGQPDVALHHYRESIRYCEVMQDRFASGRTRRNAARALASTGRFADAREWARAALCDYEASANADQEVIETLKLLERIESDLRATSQPS